MQMLNKDYINFLKKQNILILGVTPRSGISIANVCLLYTSDAADDHQAV